MSLVTDRLGAVVIGRNEGQRLIDCIRSIQRYFDNVVYVDSGSTDGSVAAAERMGVTVVALDMSVPFTAARARNQGFAALKALKPQLQYVQFIDGDCEMLDGWVEAALALLEERRDIAVVCGLRTERYPTRTIYNQIVDDEWNPPSGETLACGGDALMRIDAFEQVSGFDDGLIAGEEPELCVRLRQHGWKIWRLDVGMTKHDIAMTRFGQWWTRGVRSGFACTEVALRYWNSPFGIWKRDTLNALAWAAALPAVIVVGSLFHPAFLLLLFLYPVQVVRLAIRRRGKIPRPWVGSVFTVIDRFAYVQGLLVLAWRRLLGRTHELIEYK